ncbi:hypothetical protein MRB53_038279 [Persea americana]|nr:hypothetical protein MRB53_038279 [Persea americana]
MRLRTRTRGDSIAGRKRGESLAAMSKRMDFSFGASAASAADDFGDVHDESMTRRKIPISVISPSQSRPPAQDEDIGRRASLASRFGRATSRASTFAHGAMPQHHALQRTATDAMRKTSIHRNRFSAGRAWNPRGWSRAWQGYRKA